jgi:cell division protease FtsH
MRLWVAALVLGLALNYWLATQATQAPPRVRIPYSPFFLSQVRQGDVKQITSNGTAIQGDFRKRESYAGSRPSARFKTEIPAFADGNALTNLLQEKGVVINAVPLQSGLVWWESLLYGFGPTILIVAILVWFLRRMRRSGGGLSGAFGRSKARRYTLSDGSVGFDDVAGIDEAKTELSEVVDFLRDPEKYHRLGGRIPHGVLLSGPPGTGKTLLARAVAGEAHVPFFSMSASEFVEAIVGVGASRVRSLFAQAKEVAPSIVFVDELDAVGRARSTAGGFGGGSDEREQTLNQILTEMDGFDSSSSVIVIAATNRPDILDTALLRPGRFDRHVFVQAPDKVGRKKILEVHARFVPLGPDVDLERLAATTPGMVGADLANLVNEATLLAARRNLESVSQAELTDALERIILGAERQIVMRPEDRRRTAYHEAGHALVGMLTRGADPVRKISIIPRGRALGVTISSPHADRYNYSEHELQAWIDFALGGRAAEELVFGDRTTGAEGDIKQVTDIARRMVGKWGMSSDIGMVEVLQENASPLEVARGHSERTQELVDIEVRRIVATAYARVHALLQENRERLERLTEALLENETLDEDAAYVAADIAPVPAPDFVS